MSLKNSKGKLLAERYICPVVADFPAVFFKLCHGRQQIKIQIQFKVELGNQLLVELNVDEMAVLLSTSKEVQAAKGRDRYGEHGRECPLMKVKWRGLKTPESNSHPPTFAFVPFSFL